MLPTKRSGNAAAKPAKGVGKIGKAGGQKAQPAAPRPTRTPKAKAPAFEPAKLTAAVKKAMEQDVPIAFSEEGRDNLIPWIAAGAHMVHTSGQALLCGARALLASYQTARRIAAPDGTWNEKLPTINELRDWIGTPQFRAEVDEHYAIALQGMPPDMTKEIRDGASNVRNFDVNTLHIWIRMLNRLYGTNYTVTPITQGYNVSWKNGAFDTKYQQPTGQGDVGPGRPIVWLYNDNAEAIDLRCHQTQRSIYLSHWVGFGTSATRDDQEWIEETNGWFTEDVIDQDLEGRVLVVTEDCPGDKKRNLLRIYAGNFVTLANLPEGSEKPEGLEWVRRRLPLELAKAPNGPAKYEPQHGFVPISSLKHIRKDMLLSGKAEMLGPQPGIKPATTPAATTPAATKPPAGTRNSAVTQVPSESNTGSRRNFVVYRSIDPTSKSGRKYGNPNDPAKKFVDDFTFDDYEFLIDTFEPLENFYPQLTRMDGTSGRVKPRNLQQLTNPWGLGERLPIVDPSKKLNVTPREYTFSEKSTLKVLAAEILDRGILKSGRSKKAKFEAIVEYDKQLDEKNWKVRLPLSRIGADVPGQPGPPKLPRFEKGEIVLELGPDEEGNSDSRIVTDYEGRVGRVDAGNLTAFDGNPWALDLDAKETERMLANVRKAALQGKRSLPKGGKKKKRAAEDDGGKNQPKPKKQKQKKKKNK